jgi:hypothetical protein
MTQPTEGDIIYSIAVTKICILLAAFSASCIGILLVSKVVQTPCISLFREFLSVD